MSRQGQKLGRNGVRVQPAAVRGTCAIIAGQRPAGVRRNGGRDTIRTPEVCGEIRVKSWKNEKNLYNCVGKMDDFCIFAVGKMDKK